MKVTGIYHTIPIYFVLNSYPGMSFERSRYTPTFDATHHNNGDGSLIYPGPHGPLSSLRLEAMVDGMEDYNLFRLLGLTVNNSDGGQGSVEQPGRIWSKAADLITQLISNSSCLMENDPTFGKYNKNGTGWAPGCGRLNDPILLEKLRREAARRVIGQLKTDDGTLRKLDHACGLWQQPGAIQVLQQ